MPSKPSESNPAAAGSESRAAQAEPMAPDAEHDPVSRWIAQGIDQGVKPEQALAFIGLGLMQRMAAGVEGGVGWSWSEEEDGGSADLAGLRQRLELVRLALETGAPLSTAELSQLLGARPGGPLVERGGLRARRLGRNIWTLSRLESESRSEERFGYGFHDGRRRL
ncbi:MAG: hypothetical protein VKI83_07300 [Synechococcaceae cyanobacterium]|nr:hypothetical protein [Synechococcaceae cyanobacterium]